MPVSAPGRAGETPEERDDRNLVDLLQELRVATLSVAYHRLLFRRHQLGYLLRAANALAIGGMIAVALAVTCAVLLVTSFVQPGAPAIALSGVVALLFTVLWFLLPLARRTQLPAQSDAAHPRRGSQ